jgi:flagellar biosynthesis/type III secretory pathway protein FliH
MQLPPTSIITTTTAKAATYIATNDANDTMRVDTATDISSMNDIDSEPLLFTYTHNEVQKLIEEAQLGGWQQGFEERHRTGRKTGKEEGKADGYEEGYERK